MNKSFDFDWMINGKIIPFKLSKFFEKLISEDNHNEVIKYYELLINEGYESQMNDYCKRHYCKALYSLLKKEESIDICIEYVDKITSNSEQMPSEKEHYNQYVNSIIFLVKRIKKSNNPNYNTICRQLTKLNPDILSSSELELVSSDGKDYVNVSSRELYYTLYIKSLIKIENFDLCIAVADKALKSIDKWNYENDVWIVSRVHYAKCRLAHNFEEDVKEYINFAYYMNKWFLYSKIADVHFRQGIIDKSIHFYAKAIITSNHKDIEGLVNVLYDFALLLIDKYENIAKKLLILCYQTRKNNGWILSPGIKYYAKLLDLELDTKVNFRGLQKDLVKLTDMAHGEIKFFNKEKKFGYIKMNNKREIRFKGEVRHFKEYRAKRQVYFDIYYDLNIKRNRAKNLFFLD
jgi:cold shock CspA family protein